MPKKTQPIPPIPKPSKQATKPPKGSESLNLKIPANKALTAGNFQIDDDGNVIIKNKEMKALLSNKFKSARDQAASDVTVGVVVSVKW